MIKHSKMSHYHFPTQEAEFNHDSGELVMDYIDTQEAAVLPLSIKRHI
jgi:hypothetical protein